MPLKICVYGAGAVGGLIAGRLARAGHEVSVVARGKILTAIREDGLRVVSQDAPLVATIKAEENPANLGPQDYVILTVKAHGVADAAKRIAPLLGPDTSIVTAQNGVPWWFFDRLAFGGGRERLESLDPDGALARAMPTERIVGCVIHLAASVPKPGTVQHGKGRRLILGEPGGRNTTRTQGIADALGKAGFEIQMTNSIEKEFWVKLLGNVSFNPVSALTLATSDRLIADASVRECLVRVMREVLAIGRAVGVDAAIDPEARMDMARALGVFRTSMLQDLESGKALEIDGLLAGTLEIARKAGVAAPHTEALFGLIRARASMTNQYRPTA